MTTKQLQDLIEKPPVHITPDFVPLCKLALEVAQFADDAGVPNNTEQRPMKFAHNVIDEITAQVNRARTALASSKSAAVTPAAPPAAPTTE
jgi:hypothetical protein